MLLRLPLASDFPGDLNQWTLVIQAVGIVLVVGSLLVGWRAVEHARRSLEDGRLEAGRRGEQEWVERYRAIVVHLPIDALLNRPVARERVQDDLRWFYLYFDLCNEQAWAFERGRLAGETWLEWRRGIESNLRRPAFRLAWQLIADDVGSDFEEFRRLRADVGLPDLAPDG